MPRPIPATAQDLAQTKRPLVLVVLGYYVPGYKSGGPVRSVVSMVTMMREHHRFAIYTRDRDSGERAPYPKVRGNAWNRVGNARVFYAAPSLLNVIRMCKVVCRLRPDIVYLNGFFSRLTLQYLIVRKLRIVGAIPVIVAPRGEFSPGAFALKRRKKRPYLTALRASGLLKDVLFQASTTMEEREIRRVLGPATRIATASNLTTMLVPAQRNGGPPKRPGEARFIYISRISPKKNLLFALEMLKEIQATVVYQVYGLVEDEQYWQRCLSVINHLPANVQVSYMGPLTHEKVPDALGGNHFFLLPTLGENFGHAILEALAAGCPPLVGNDTPWRGLQEAAAGWDLPPWDAKAWQEALRTCVAMDDEAHRNLAASSMEYARRWLVQGDWLGQNLALMKTALSISEATRP